MNRKAHILFLVLICINLFSQTTPIETGEEITVDENRNNESVIFEARDYVRYLPEYKYKPQNTNDVMIGRINDNLIFDVDYTNSIDVPNPENEQINTNLAVGGIIGNYGVTNTGSSSYSISIYTPKGIKGMQPNINLQYSNNNYGIAGAGWNISGLSVISRTNKDYYHDGKVEDMILGTSGKYNLDGNRLIYNDNYTYFLENENFSEVKYETTANFFIVKKTNGIISEYGNTIDSKFKLNNDNSKTINWYINKVTDKFGNSIVYNYKNENNEIVIESIEYVGTTNKIEFLYQTRTVDNTKGFLKGYLVEKKKLLRKIKVFSSNILVREYEFKYTESNNFITQLYEIIEKGLNGEQFNSLICNYEEQHYNNGTGLNSIDLLNYTEVEDADYTTGDFNGDGINDLVAYTYDNSSGAKVYDKLKLYLSDNLSYNLTSTVDIPSGFFPFHPQDANRFSGYPNNGIYKIDINADGNEDLVLKFGYGGVYNYIPYYSNGNGFDVGNTCLTISVSEEHRIAFGDFNGDAKLDIFALIYKDGNDKYIINNIENENNSLDYYTYINLNIDIGNLTDSIKSINPINFNNDSKTELLIRDSYKGFIVKFKGNPNSIIPAKDGVVQIESLFEVQDNYLIGDFNGDGISDLCPVSNSSISIKYGNGIGYEEDYIEVTTNIPISIDKYNTVIFDFNKDGKDDILRYGDNKMYIFYYQSNNNFIEKNYTYSISNNDHFIGFGTYGVTGLSGQSDYYRLIFQQLYNGPKTHDLIIAGKPPYLLSKIRDSYGNVAEFQYSNLTNNYLYVKGGNAVFPIIDYQGTLSVVSSITSSNGIGGTISNNYKYEVARVHIQGRGFLGFSKITTISENANKKVIKNFTYDDYYYVNNYSKTEVKTFGGNSISETETFFELTQYYDISTSDTYLNGYRKRFCQKLSSTNNHDFLKSIFTNTTFTYDNYKNVLTSITNINNEYTISKNYNYSNNFFFVGDVPSLIEQKTETITKQGEAPFTKTVNFTYNNGIPSTKESMGITTHYENYDNYGNPTKIRTSTNDILLADRSETVTFDNTGRFVTSRTNQLNQTIEYEYDPIWGEIKKAKDITGLETNYEYDNWGRLKRIISPTGLVTTNSIHWLTNEDTDMPTALYYTLSQTTDLPYKKTYFDSFGRKLRVETKSFGKKLFADIRYDKYGHQIETYDTYFEGGFGSAEITTNEYDNFSRISKTIYKDIETSFSYNNGGSNYSETTIFDATGTAPKVYQSFYDAIGNITKSQSPNGTVENTFASNGQAINILAQNVGTSMQYDETTAQQTSLTDPNSGTTSYEYNQFGELIKQTDANNKVQEVVIDDYGRTDYTENDEGQTNIEYVENGNGLGQVKSVEAPNGNKTENIYDEFGRTIQTIETIDAQNYTHSFEYDQYGKVTKETYPSGFELTYIYNSQGELLSVKQTDNSQTIWYCNDYNEKGQPNKIYLGANGSNLKTTYQYNGFSRITNIKTGFDFDNNYEWDNTTGNLLKRTNGDNIEVFTYDLLDRLETWEVNGSLFTMQYSSNGNINHKPQVGNYTYDPSKVHAITQIHNPTSAISLQQQDIEYTSFNKANTITEDNFQLQIEYGAENYRKKTTLQENGTTINTRIFVGNYEKEILEDGTVKEYHYISGPTGLIAIYIITNGIGHLYYTATDHLGSICQILETNGTVVEETNYDPWGRIRNENWEYEDNLTGLTLIPRGYTGHEHLQHFALINMNGRMYDPVIGRMLSPDNYVQDPSNAQNYNRYAYVLNNPLKYTDPSGDFLTWSFGNGGFSLGLNFTPIGIPLGFGINIGYGDGFAPGVYGEVGYRVGGTGLGSGVTVSQGLDYNFKHSTWSTTTSEGAYASFGPFNAGVNFSQTYDMSSNQWSNGWGVSAGVGIGNDMSGIGFNIGYGSGGWSYGIGGYYNSKAWESNPVYVPDEWNDNGEIQTTNNCYSYALDDKENGNYWGLQPGEAGGQPITSTSDVNLDYVTNGAISDGRIKKPNLINKLGFGKRGYYSAYLVIDEGVDYHWYRQDKGGNWSHKPGITPVVNVDASRHLIRNPARANHHYPSVNYNNGGILLWIRR